MKPERPSWKWKDMKNRKVSDDIKWLRKLVRYYIRRSSIGQTLSFIILWLKSGRRS